MLLKLIKLTIKGSFSKADKKNPTKVKSTLPMFAVLLAIIGVSYYAMYRETAELYLSIGAPVQFFQSLGSQLLLFLMLTDISLVSSQLLESKYNDVLLTLPLKPSYITISRLLTSILYGYGLTLAFGVPALIAWVSVAGFSATLLVRGIVMMIFWRFIPLSIGVIVGYLFNKLTYRSKYKNLLKSFFSLAFIGVYYYFIFSSTSGGNPDPNSGLSSILSKIALLKWFAEGIYSGNLLYCGIIIALAVALMAIVMVFLNKVLYKSIISVKNSKKVTKTHTSFVRKPVIISLVRRELKHIMNSYIYLTNNAISLLFMIAAIVFVVIKRDEILYLMKLDLFEPIAVALATGALCMLCSTYMVSSCSISIEGKNIDALKSLPLESQTVLESKLLFHYVFPGIIMLVGSVLTGILFKVKPLSFVSLILIPQLYLVVTDMMGLYFNLLFPKMDWANEEAVVKRGISVLLSMLTGMALIGLVIGAYFLFLDEYLVLDVYLLVVAGVLLLLAVGLYFLIMTNGVKRFEKIHKGV